ncbi:MAG: hypothetical protein FJ306_13600 [Planctomycetes bacterium]|nr:hypothetical protein [Planctomycetota bacterium]
MTGLDDLVAARDRVLIRQTKEWAEILLGFESKNRFELADGAGQRPASPPKRRAASVSGSCATCSAAAGARRCTSTTPPGVRWAAARSRSAGSSTAWTPSTATGRSARCSASGRGCTACSWSRTPPARR